MGNQNILKERTNAAQQSNATDRSYMQPKDTNLPKQDVVRLSEYEVKKKIKGNVSTKFGDRILTESKNIEFIETLSRYVDNLLQNEKLVEDIKRRKILVQEILDDILGFGPLQPLLEDPSVTEIMVTHYTKVYKEQYGKLVLDSSIVFENDDALRNVIEKIVQPIGRRIDESEPLVDARLPDGSRVNATIPPISPDGCTLTIRKFSKNKLGEADYLRFGSLSPAEIDFFKGAVIAKANIIIAGGTGSGKTTFLNVLSNFCSSSDSIVTVEDSCELTLYQDNVRRLECRPANAEGKGQITIRDLVKNTLRMRPDRIIVGEIRDGAIVDMLTAMGTGHDGSLSTIHTNSPRDLVDNRIGILFGMSDLKFSETAIKKLICSAIDIIIQVSRLPDGSRKITHVTHVVGYGKEGASKLKFSAENIEPDKIYLQDIFKFVETDVDNDGKIHGVYTPTGYIPKEIIDKAKSHRHTIPLDLFDVEKSKWVAGELPAYLKEEDEKKKIVLEQNNQQKNTQQTPYQNQQFQQTQQSYQNNNYPYPQNQGFNYNQQNQGFNYGPQGQPFNQNQ